jgi:hypothetical protein
MRRGEVWQVRIPYAPGHAQGGERPAIRDCLRRLGVLDVLAFEQVLSLLDRLTGR